MSTITIPLLEKTKQTLKRIPYCHFVFDPSSGEKFDNGSVWLLPDGKMYLSPMNEKGDREHFNIAEVIQKVDPKFEGKKTKPIRYFQTNTDSIRVRCFKQKSGKELAVEYNVDQNLPNYDQIKTLKNEFCDGNYDSLIYQVSDIKSKLFLWHSHESNTYKRDELGNCGMAVDLMMKEFERIKYPEKEKEFLESEAKRMGTTVDEVIKRREEHEKLMFFHEGSIKKKRLL